MNNSVIVRVLVELFIWVSFSVNDEGQAISAERAAPTRLACFTSVNSACRSLSPVRNSLKYLSVRSFMLCNLKKVDPSTVIRIGFSFVLPLPVFNTTATRFAATRRAARSSIQLMILMKCLSSSASLMHE